MKESKLYSEFQRLGKVLMAPVLLLPVSGILVGLGSALSNANLISLCPFLGTEPMVIFSTLIKAAGNVINGNISVLFAICIAYGYAKAEKATAALSGFIGYMTMNTIMGQLLILLGTIDPANLQTGQNAILGVTTLDTGVFGGIIIGLVVAWIHNRFYKVQLPPVLGIFNGTRCVPALTVVFASLVRCTRLRVPICANRPKGRLDTHRFHRGVWRVHLWLLRAHASALRPASFHLPAVFLHFSGR